MRDGFWRQCITRKFHLRRELVLTLFDMESKTSLLSVSSLRVGRVSVFSVRGVEEGHLFGRPRK